MLDTRTLQNQQDLGDQPQWSVKISREQMRNAALAELARIEDLWREKRLCWAGDSELSANAGDVLTAPKPQKLGSGDSTMRYRGRMTIDPIRGSVDLVDLPGSPSLDMWLSAGAYEVDLQVIRKLDAEP